MGLRFQKRIALLPGVRLNLSKGGVSASLGPRGADVNIGRDGITTNAGIPGTGLSYRQKLGGGASAEAGSAQGKSGKSGLLGILALVAGLGVWAFQHWAKIEKTVPPAPTAVTVTPRSAASAPVNIVPSGLRYVHRNGAVLRAEPKASAGTLKKETKGAEVTLLQDIGGGWAKVQDGGAIGYMRAGTLGIDPPR